MIMKSVKRIKTIIKAVDRKTGYKNINLTSAIQSLVDGYTATKGTGYVEKIGGGQIESCNRIISILDKANKKTGCKPVFLMRIIPKDSSYRYRDIFRISCRLLLRYHRK